MKMNSMKYFFEPKSVAIIGASRKPGKIGHVILKNFVENFKGRIYPVNPHAESILRKKTYHRITAIPDNIDLAVIVVPAVYVPEVVRDCASKKVKAAVIISGGFSEIGNVELEDQIKEVVNRTDIRVIGVNCLGIFDAHSKIDTMFLPPFKLHRPKEGVISFISQSGAVGSIVLDWISSEGFGVSKMISYGNATDINEADLLEYLGKDPKTRVICMYLEGVKDGKKMMRVARNVSKRKPIIVVKGGRTAEGSHAVSSHTGSLAGSDLVFDAAFKQSGMIRAEGIIQMFDFARALAEQPPSHGDRVQIITNGGGFGVLATDEIVEQKLKMAKMSKNTELHLRNKLRKHAVIANPLDLVGDAEPADYKYVLKLIERDKNIDAILCIVLFQTSGMSSEIVKILKDFSDRCSKPIVVCSSGGEYTKRHTRQLEAAGVPTYDAPIRAAQALDAVIKYGHIVGLKRKKKR